MSIFLLFRLRLSLWVRRCRRRSRWLTRPTSSYMYRTPSWWRCWTHMSLPPLWCWSWSCKSDWLIMNFSCHWNWVTITHPTVLSVALVSTLKHSGGGVKVNYPCFFYMYTAYEKYSHFSKIYDDLDGKLNVLEWPCQSPDISLIENLWLDLKKADRRVAWQSLSSFIKQRGVKFAVSRCVGLIETYPHRLSAVIEAKAASTW